MTWGADMAGTASSQKNKELQKILGIDLSKKMIEEAQKRNSGNQIEYRISGLEEYDYPENEWDCVISNLALHYIEDIVEIFEASVVCVTRG